MVADVAIVAAPGARAFQPSQPDAPHLLAEMNRLRRAQEQGNRLTAAPDRGAGRGGGRGPVGP